MIEKRVNLLRRLIAVNDVVALIGERLSHCNECFLFNLPDALGGDTEFSGKFLKRQGFSAVFFIAGEPPRLNDAPRAGIKRIKSLLQPFP